MLHEYFQLKLAADNSTVVWHLEIVIFKQIIKPNHKPCSHSTQAHLSTAMVIMIIIKHYITVVQTESEKTSSHKNELFVTIY